MKLSNARSFHIQTLLADSWGEAGNETARTMKPLLLGDIHRNAFIFHHHQDYEITAAELSGYKRIQHPWRTNLKDRGPSGKSDGEGKETNHRWEFNEAPPQKSRGLNKIKMGWGGNGLEIKT